MTTIANSRFAKAAVSCFYYTLVYNSAFVFRINISANNPRLYQAHNAKPTLPFTKCVWLKNFTFFPFRYDLFFYYGKKHPRSFR